MKKATNEATASSVANDRTIPPPPGGGSWKFDEVKWAWVSNDPAPADESAAAAGTVNTVTQQEQ